MKPLYALSTLADAGFKKRAMTKTSATIIGFLTAPLISAVIGVILTPTSEGQGVLSLLGLLPIFYFFSALATILFGVPTFFMLRYFKLINWWSTLGTGIIAGALVAVILRLPSPLHVHDFMTLVPIGVVSAFGFWLICRQGR